MIRRPLGLPNSDSKAPNTASRAVVPHLGVGGMQSVGLHTLRILDGTRREAVGGTFRAEEWFQSIAT
jgi:hypothetical protein